jgi:predicted permease
MMRFTSLRLKLRAVLRPNAVENELDDEIRFHLEREIEKHLRSGMSPVDARRQAMIHFGGVERVKEEYRDGRGDRPLSDLAGDTRYALRQLRRNPTLATAAILTLALGIGANVAIFSAVNAVMLRPLPFAAPSRLAMLWEDNADKDWHQQEAAPANMLDWQDQVKSFAGLAGYQDFFEDATLALGGEPQVIKEVGVTGGFFSVLGVTPALGRGFEERDTWQGGPLIAVISHRAWRERFGSDPNVVGRSVTLNGRSVQIMGVMPPSFAFPTPEVDLWFPTAWDPNDRGQVFFRRAHWMRPFARLRDGVSLEQARAELKVVMSRLERQHPETNIHMEADVGDLHTFLVGTTRGPLLILLGATGLLLLIACANVGNLMLVRAAAREREVVLRRALGATNGRMVRQTLTESAVLSLIGGVAGLGVGWWGTRALAAFQPAGLLPVQDVRPDLRVFLFVLAVSAISAALFGLAPAVWSVRRSPADVLKETTRGSGESRRARSWGNALAIGEVALALMLTSGGGLLVRSFMQLTRVNPGFDATRVLAVALALPGQRYDTGEKQTTFIRQLLTQVQEIPGAERAAVVSKLPLNNLGAWTSDFSVRGRAAADFGRNVQHRELSPDYFRVMGVPLVTGRMFTESDDPSGERVVIINKLLADKYFKGQDPVGQYLAFDAVPDSTSKWRRIVGVVGSEHQRSLALEPEIEIFAPIAQDQRSFMQLTVRGPSDPMTILSAVHKAISRLDPALALLAVTTMEEVRTTSVARERFMATLLMVFAAVGVLLAIIGVYGVVAQLAQRRIQEMGIRIALGAQVPHVRWLIVRHGIALTGAGVSLGAVGAMLLGGVIQQMVFGITVRDPVIFTLMPIVLVLTGACASWIPAARATRADPAAALRA